MKTYLLTPLKKQTQTVPIALPRSLSARFLTVTHANGWKPETYLRNLVTAVVESLEGEAAAGR